MFFCQSTSLKKATLPLPIWNIRQYMWDISSGTVGLLERTQMLLTSLNSIVRKSIAGRTYAATYGRLEKTPTMALNLQPGELVEVKSKEEILSTLDFTGRNRGLVFNAEMLKYCNKKYRVFRRVDKMISEKTHKMRKIANTVILEGSMCDGKTHGGCQRTCYCLWREIWLERTSNQLDRAR